jgi:hypothetical protein
MEEARQRLEERADEHRAAIAAALEGLPEPPALPLIVTRSMPEAHDRSGHARDSTALRDFGPAALAWLAVLERARDRGLREACARVGRDACVAITEAAWQVVREAPRPRGTTSRGCSPAASAPGGAARSRPRAVGARR